VKHGAILRASLLGLILALASTGCGRSTPVSEYERARTGAWDGEPPAKPEEADGGA